MDERQGHPSWPIVMAVAGLALIGLETILIAPNSVALALERFDRSLWPLEATIMRLLDDSPVMISCASFQNGR